MIGKRQRLEVRSSLPWVEVGFRDTRGSLCTEWLILDTGSSHTILSEELAKALGLRRARKSELAIFDAPDRSERAYPARVPALIFCGREIQDYTVYCAAFQEKLHIPGLLGFDFFEETDFLISRERQSVQLSW
jgi:predicted aspartyl protease